MNPSDTLSTVAEIALGLAGFSGLLVVLGRQPGHFSLAEVARLAAMLVASLSALFLAIIPLVLHDFGLSGASLWRASSSIMGVSILGSAALLARPVRQFRASESRAYSPYILWSVLLGALAVLLVQTANILGLLGSPGAGPYSLGLLFFLAVGALQFVRILFVRSD